LTESTTVYENWYSFLSNQQFPINIKNSYFSTTLNTKSKDIDI